MNKNKEDFGKDKDIKQEEQEVNKKSFINNILDDINLFAEDKSYISDLVVNLIQKVAEENKDAFVSRNVISFIQSQINILTKKISHQLDEVLHNPAFKNLEEKWRGLFHLVNNVDTNNNMIIRVLDATKHEITRDVTRAIEFDQSRLFKLIHEEEFGSFGGKPYSYIVYDEYFSSSTIDIETLSKISGVAAASHCPILTSVKPNIFNIDTFRDLNKPRDLAKIFSSTDRIKWNSFRSHEDSKYIVFVLPRVLIRQPYSDDYPCNNFDYTETVNPKNDEHFVWMNSAYPLGVNIARACSTYGWPAAIRGVEGGGLIENLPCFLFEAEEGDLSLKCPTEVVIPDRRERELSDLGFVSICFCKESDKAVFFSVQTCYKNKSYSTEEANANAKLSSSLPYLLAGSRFAHSIKDMMRQKIGSFTAKEEITSYLQDWISEFVLLNDVPSQEVKARLPLREAKIEVFDVPGNPGSYTSTIFISPHFQFNDMNVSLRVVAKIPAASN